MVMGSKGLQCTLSKIDSAGEAERSQRDWLLLSVMLGL